MDAEVAGEVGVDAKGGGDETKSETYEDDHDHNDFNGDNPSETTDSNNTIARTGGPSNSSGECVAVHISCPNIGTRADVELIVSICEVDSSSTESVTYSKVIASGTMSGLQIGFYRSFIHIPDRKYSLKMEFRGDSIHNDSHHSNTKHVDLNEFGPFMVEMHPSITSAQDRRHSVSVASTSSTTNHPPAYLLVQYFPAFDNPSIYVGPSTLILPGSHAESSWEPDAPPTNFIVYLDDSSSRGSSSASSGASVAEVLDGVYRCHKASKDAVHAAKRKGSRSGPSHGTYFLARAVFEGSFASPTRPASASTSPSHHDHFNRAFRGRAGSFQHHGASHYPSIPSMWTIPNVDSVGGPSTEASNKAGQVTTTAFQQYLHVDHNTTSSLIYHLNDPVELLASLIVPETNYYNTSNADKDDAEKPDDAGTNYSVWGVGMLKEIDRHPLRQHPSGGSSNTAPLADEPVVVILEGRILRNRPVSASSGNMISNAVQAVSSALSQFGFHTAADPTSLLKSATNNSPVVIRVAVLLNPTTAHPLAVTNRCLISKKASSRPNSRPSSASKSAAPNSEPVSDSESNPAPAVEEDDIAAAVAAMLSRADSMKVEEEAEEVTPTRDEDAVESSNNKNSADSPSASTPDKNKPENGAESEVLDKMHRNNAHYSPRSPDELDQLVAESIAELDVEDDPASIAIASKANSSSKNTSNKALASKEAGAGAAASAKTAQQSNKVPGKSAKDQSVSAAPAPMVTSNKNTKSSKQPGKGGIDDAESEMRSKSSFQPSPDPVSAVNGMPSVKSGDEDLEYEEEYANWQPSEYNSYDDGPTFEGLLAQNKSLKKAIDECRIEITGLRADNAQNKAALQEKARKNVEEVQRNEDMARMLTELVQSNDEKSKDVLQKGPIQEFHHKDLVQLSKAQLLALAQISTVKYIDIKRKLQNEQALQQEVGELKQKLATITQARDDLESNMFLQNKYLQKMQKQIAQVENYRSTISMQEKVIAKMQSVVESKMATAGGMNLINSKAGAFPTKPVATGSTVSPLTNARNQQLDNNSNNNHNLESERIQQELQEAKNKNSELQHELEDKRQSLDYANENVRLLQEDVANLKQV
jgi:hypothetical protein